MLWLSLGSVKREFFHLVCVVRLEFAYSTIARPPTNECGAVLVSRASLKVRFFFFCCRSLFVSMYRLPMFTLTLVFWLLLDVHRCGENRHNQTQKNMNHQSISLQNLQPDEIYSFVFIIGLNEGKSYRSSLGGSLNIQRKKLTFVGIRSASFSCRNFFFLFFAVFNLAPRWGGEKEIVVLQLASESPPKPPPHSFVSRFRSIFEPSKLTVNYQQRTHTSHANGSISSEIFIQDNYFFSFFLPSMLLDANNRLSYVCCYNFLKVSAHYFSLFNNLALLAFLQQETIHSSDDHITSLLLPWIHVSFG